MPKRPPVPHAWRPLRDLSPEGKAFTASHPALYLHLYCNFSGVHCTAHVDWLAEDGHLHRTTIAHASWKPPAVSERLVVEWAHRALGRWLEDTLEPDPQPEVTE